MYSSKQCTIVPDIYPFSSAGYNGVNLMKQKQGFKEIEHTADVAMHVLAETLPALFHQAALGLYALAEIEMQEAPVVSRSLCLEAQDVETLLVIFLSELLFQLDRGAVLQAQLLEVDGNTLTGIFMEKKITQIHREIKAVTYHRLHVVKENSVFRTDIVLDV